MWKHFKKESDRVRHGADGGETYAEILRRMISFLKNIDKKYKGQNILIVSHEGPLFLLQGKVMGYSIKKTITKFPLEKNRSFADEYDNHQLFLSLFYQGRQDPIY